MSPNDFVYWLQGYAEIAQQAPTAGQWKVIQDHLQLVFKKETPIRATESGAKISRGETWPADKRFEGCWPRREIDPADIHQRLCAPAAEYPFEALRCSDQLDCSTLTSIPQSC